MPTCDVNTLAVSSSPFQAYSYEQQLMVQTYLLAVIAGLPTNPETLLAAAKQFQALSEKETLMVQAYLLCKINGG